MSSSPDRHRQLRSRIRIPCRCKYSAASSSPCRPSMSLALIATSCTKPLTHLNGLHPANGPMWNAAPKTATVEEDTARDRGDIIAAMSGQGSGNDTPQEDAGRESEQPVPPADEPPT